NARLNFSAAFSHLRSIFCTPGLNDPPCTDFQFRPLHTGCGHVFNCTANWERGRPQILRLANLMPATGTWLSPTKPARQRRAEAFMFQKMGSHSIGAKEPMFDLTPSVAWMPLAFCEDAAPSAWRTTRALPAR